MTSLVYDDGTASVTNGSAVVVGQSTAWVLGLVAGGMFSLAGLSIPIKSVDTDTKLTLAYGWPGDDTDEAEYAIAREFSQAVRAAWINDRMATFHQKPWGLGVQPDGRGTLAERDALDPMPYDNFCWLRVEVDEPVELYFKVTDGWIGPYAIMGEDGPIGPPGPALVPAGEWNSETNYPRGRYVRHGSRAFASKVNDNEGNEPPAADEDDAFWMFVPAVQGATGSTGSGWAAVFAIVADDERRVYQVVDWIAGTGTKPATGMYVGDEGFVEDIADAADIRGSAGAGDGDVKGPNSVTSGYIVLFDGTTGKLVKSGGKFEATNLPTDPSGTFEGDAVEDVLDDLEGRLVDAEGLAANALQPEDIGVSVAAQNDSRITGALQSADVATFPQFNATTPDKVLKTDSVWSDLGVLTDASTIAISFNNGYDFGGASNVPLAIAGNRTLGAPQNVRNGKKGVLWFTASGATRTLTLHANWILAAGVEAGPYSITTSETLGIAYVSRGTTVIVTGIVRVG